MLSRRFTIIILLFLFAVTASAQVAVTGTVVDPSGAPVAGATVSIDGRQPTTTGTLGRFRLDAASGRHQIEVSAGSAFRGLRRTIDVRSGMPALTLQLSLPVLQEKVEVTADDVRPTLDTAANLDTTTLSGEALENLPAFDQDVVGALTPLLDPASIATSGPTLIVDGVEVNKAGVPRSAIDRIAINDDPYTAESNRPGRGRIEIMTKPGSGDVHGNVAFTFRNASLASRSYFAPSKPPEQRQAFEGMLSGPLNKRTNFMITFSRQNDEAVAVVHALTPAGAVDQNAAAPSSNLELMARLSQEWSEKHRASLQVNWSHHTVRDRGVGGVVLPQAGVNSAERETDVFFAVRSLLNPERMNQFQLTLEFNEEPTTSVSAAQGLVVRDAFVGGGAQATNLRTESGGKLNDIFTVMHGRHVFKAGIQIPNLNRRVFHDSTNQGGTFSFASLPDYIAGRPYAYVLQQGAGRASFWWREYGAFVQDQVKVAKNLQVAFGLRYDWQSQFHDANNFAPRASVAWSPRGDSRTVVRAGSGVFYDRSGAPAVANLLLHDGVRLRSYTILNPSYPDPLAGGLQLSSIPTNITRLAPDIQIPYNVQSSAGIERQISKSASMVVSYRHIEGHHLFRSVNANAPLLPDFSAVSDPRYGVIQEIRSDGRMHSDAIDLTLRGRTAKHFSGQIQYTLSRAVNDTNGINWYPSNQYAAADAEWGPADFDQRHRLNVLGTIKAGRWVNLGIAGKFYSGLPYSMTAGADLFHTGLANARPPGVDRNSLRASAYRSLDVRLSHNVALGPPKGDEAREITLAVDAFNVFNHANFSGYVGNVRSPFFLLPTTSSPGRRVQLSAEVKF